MNELNLLDVLRQTTTVTRFVLAVLLIFSVWSWGIIFSKTLLLRKIRKESETFWKVFRRGQNLSEIRTACETFAAARGSSQSNRRSSRPSQAAAPLPVGRLKAHLPTGVHIITLELQD